MNGRVVCVLWLLACCWSPLGVRAANSGSSGSEPSGAESSGPAPNVVVLTVDTLRADRMSAYGYDRTTSPAIDRLMAAGVRFDSARTPEPLTAPAMASMWTGLAPHDHGCTRNGLSIHDDLPSLSKLLHLRGYETSALVGNWTLRDQLSGLGAHFQHYEELFTRKRWFGLVKGEATADDLNEQAIDWLDDYLERDSKRPFLLWIHYVEPHAPYRQWEEFVEPLGYSGGGELEAAERYDTEIAHVDARIGEFLNSLYERVPEKNTMVVFAADHGESLGEHDYWGHGRNLQEPNLRVPLSITWPRAIAPAVVSEDASLLDLPRTVLGLLGLSSSNSFAGFDWGPVLLGRAEAPNDRVTFYQAHKGAVQPTEVPEKARRRGLLSIARMSAGKKVILRVAGARSRRDRAVEFDLTVDPDELEPQAPTASVAASGDPTPDSDSGGAEEVASSAAELEAWLEEVLAGLDRADASGEVVLDAETIEQLRSLGYID